MPRSRIDSTPLSGPEQAARRRVVAASWATFTVFALNGFIFASWVSRIPAVRDGLNLGPATIGLILLVGSIGSVSALPLTGAVVTKLGTRRTVLLASVLAAVGYAGVVGGFLIGSVIAMAVAMAVASVGIAGWDVAMNLEGAMVEQGLGRAIMPIYHAGFSLGTVVGAAIGAVMARLGVSVELHLIVAVIAVVLLVAVAIRWFLPEADAKDAAAAEGTATSDAVTEPKQAKRNPFGAWREPRTLLIGLLVLSAALTEGSANDWLTLASIEAFGLDNSDGALMLTVFLVAMTVMRFVGTGLLDRFGRVLVLRLCISFALVGLALFCFSPSAPLAVAGAVLWGMGAALGFPVGISAASDEPEFAAARVSVVATIGYTAFLAGPPLLGLLAEHVGYRNALLAIMVPLAISLLITKVATPPTGSAGEADDQVDAARAT